ncbi:MAG: sporulation protein YqfD [Bacillota bacterium]|nr:sporulation protein YqfD [Bacillota bacterium]
MTDRLIAHLFGYLIVSVSGKDRVRFLNACASQGIPQWSVRARSKSILMCTSIAGFKAMRRPARQQRCKVRVLERRGLPFVLQRMQRRATFSLGAVLFVLLLWLLSSFVWLIEIEGSEKVANADVGAYMRTQGLYVGAWRASPDLDGVASAILREYPQIVWAGISIEGSRVHVKLVDKVTVVPPLRMPGDVVAAKAGVIIKVIATSGQALATSGQTVSMGQILIRGEVVIEEQVAQEVMAEGIAVARVWYETFGHAEVSRSIQRPTGIFAVRAIVRVGTREFFVAGARVSPFGLYESTAAKRILLPGVEHITITYKELTLENEVVSAEVARLEAVRNAEASINELLPEHTTVVDKKITEQWSPDGNTVTIRVLVEAHEDIGQFIPYTN